jgi:hypothetical protein
LPPAIVQYVPSPTADACRRGKPDRLDDRLRIHARRFCAGVYFDSRYRIVELLGGMGEVFRARPAVSRSR